MSSDRVMLSTEDNPYNPFTEWDQWWAWDTSNGYNSMSLLARVVRSSDETSDELDLEAIREGMEEVVFYNVSGKHILVSEPASSVTEPQ